MFSLLFGELCVLFGSPLGSPLNLHDLRSRAYILRHVMCVNQGAFLRENLVRATLYFPLSVKRNIF